MAKTMTFNNVNLVPENGFQNHIGLPNKEWLIYGTLDGQAGNGVYYGICESPESDTQKDIYLDCPLQVSGPSMFVVTFTNAVPQDSMLYFWGNDNETQCISSIMYKGDFLEDGIIKSGDTCTFIFDGSWFVLIGIDSGISSTTSWISLLEV